MIKTILLAALATPILLASWVFVQLAWRKVFDFDTDEDALAERGGCGACGTPEACGGCRTGTNKQRRY